MKHKGNIWQSLQWDFVPSWAIMSSSSYKMINARAESLGEKASFRKAFEQQQLTCCRRWIHEWRKEGKLRKPVHIHVKSGEPMGFAGLYNVWHSPEREGICTCTVITTDSNDLVHPVHDRMPAITAKSDFESWLDPKNRDIEKLKGILKPYGSQELKCTKSLPELTRPRTILQRTSSHSQDKFTSVSAVHCTEIVKSGKYKLMHFTRVNIIPNPIFVNFEVALAHLQGLNLRDT